MIYKNDPHQRPELGEIIPDIVPFPPNKPQHFVPPMPVPTKEQMDFGEQRFEKCRQAAEVLGLLCAPVIDALETEVMQTAVLAIMLADRIGKVCPPDHRFRALDHSIAMLTLLTADGLFDGQDNEQQASDKG